MLNQPVSVTWVCRFVWRQCSESLRAASSSNQCLWRLRTTSRRGEAPPQRNDASPPTAAPATQTQPHIIGGSGGCTMVYPPLTLGLKRAFYPLRPPLPANLLYTVSTPVGWSTVCPPPPPPDGAQFTIASLLYRDSSNQRKGAALANV